MATIEDKKNVEENLLLIKQFFLNYGLSFIRFDIEISEEARNLKEIRQKRQQVQESLDETRSAEAYRQKRESIMFNMLLDIKILGSLCQFKLMIFRPIVWKWPNLIR